MLTESHRCSLTVRHWDGKEEFGLICPEFMICVLWVSSDFQNWLYILKLQRTPKKIVAKARLQFIFPLSWFKQWWVEMVIPICQGSSLLVFFMFFARSQRAHCHIHLLFNGRARYRASLIAQFIKNPPAMQKTLVRFLGWKDPLEKG